MAVLLAPLRWLVWGTSQLALTTRYRVKVEGLNRVADYPPPYLFLPNHTAYADPPNVLAALWPRFRVRPLLLETNFQNPLLAAVGWLLRAIKVPDLSSASAAARKRAEGALSAAIEALNSGDNVILWPSGRLTRDGREHLGGARAASDVLAAAPDSTAVLVRVRGLYGSCFSWADPKHPPKVAYFVSAVGWVLSNLMFFTPRRRVTITLEAFPRSKRPEPAREAINPWLEAWYNADTPAETPTFVPYHFAFGPRDKTYPPPSEGEALDLSGVKPETKAAVAELLGEKLHRELKPDDLPPERTFLDLGIDSLDAMEVSLELERRSGFAGARVPTTVGELWALAEGKLGSPEVKPAPPEWAREHSGPADMLILGETIAAAFVARALANPNDIAVADDLSGVLTYERLLIGARILAERFRELPGDAVGLMLPASVAGMTSLLALHLAGKLPVLLNWTTGPAAMEHAVKLLAVRRVVTSKQFVDRTQITVPGTQLYFLEDVRGTVGRFEKLSKFLAMKLWPARVGRNLLRDLNRDPDKPAVVLFTSGSEKAPKAVPLTHANVIGDLRASIPLLGLSRADSGLIFLPLFHSFGHTVTGMLPILTGMKSVYHPDPTDANALVRKAAAYKPTALAATPTFWGFMLDRAAPGDFDSLRIVVVGAEKCPTRLFDRSAELAPNAKIMEGYGITECGPVVAVNPYADPRPGTIGKALVGVDLAVRDVETDEPKPPGEMGMLHVSGPNVFPGYIGIDDSPFAEFDGKRWYVTGDLVAIDADGYVTFQGRLKRFLKAGGEMVSLPALEEPFAKKYPPTDDGPQVAIEGVETPEGRHVVLFTTRDITLHNANALLSEEGFRGVMRLDEVRKIERVPVLGTGKTDYKVLRGMLG